MCQRATISTSIGGAPTGASTTRGCATIKDRYDPGGLFFVHHGVGSEDWSADGFTQLR